MKNIIIILLIALSYTATAQPRGISSIDSLQKEFVNWYNLSPDVDKIEGAAVEQAYTELLNDRKPAKKIVVAVIDGGVDIHHPELAGKIWINSDEIAGNGVDDDNNGYVDDVNGWNFIGNAKGENIVMENMEYVRILRELTPRFVKIASRNEVSADNMSDYDLYLRCKEEYDREYKKYTSYRNGLEQFEQRIKGPETVLKAHLKKDIITKEDVEAIKTNDELVKESRDFFLKLFKNGFSYKGIASMKDNTNEYLDYRLNLDFDARKVIADNPTDMNDYQYGNNDVRGERSFHGTLVSGIIAAQRNNNIGINGIAGEVDIMVLRVVPDGDERDKDVALAIRYAVDNGANIINMSFGKYFSLHSHLMDDAIKYADERNVLMVKSAGNEADNLDLIECYPSKTFADGGSAKNWLTIGSTSNKKGKKFCGSFSNYGKTRVDLFAPGVNIVSLIPENKYDMANGTSFSGPVVSGVAALVWSYFPELTASELKDILLHSVNKYPKLKVYVPGTKKKKAKFSELSVTGGTVSAYEAIKLANARNQKQIL
jgi:subtilisin family serine protease